MNLLRTCILLLLAVALSVCTVNTAPPPARTFRKSPGGEPTLYLGARTNDAQRLYRWLRDRDYDAHRVHDKDTSAVHIIASEQEYVELRESLRNHSSSSSTVAALGDLQLLFNRTSEGHTNKGHNKDRDLDHYMNHNDHRQQQQQHGHDQHSNHRHHSHHHHHDQHSNHRHHSHHHHHNQHHHSHPAHLFRSAAAHGVPAGYHSLRDVESFLFYVARKFRSICRLVDLTREFGPGRTHQNNSVLAVKLSRNAHLDEDEPNVLIVALHHARELVVTEIAMRVIVHLTAAYGSDPRVTRLLDENQVWVVPVVNPDGLDHVFTRNNWWRKNRRNLGNGFYGVDLNRNYDLGWNSCGESGSESESGSDGSGNDNRGNGESGNNDNRGGNEDYSGEHPESEPEVQSLVRFSETYMPAKVLDFHSFGREVLAGYQCAALDSTVARYINHTAAKLASLVGFGVRAPTDDGEHQEYQIKRNTNFAFLVEVGDSFQPPYADALREVERVMPLVTRFLDTPVPLRGHALDKRTGRPIGNATIHVSGIKWLSGESRRTNPTFGSYYAFLPHGRYELTFYANGYHPASVTVLLGPQDTIVQDVYMEPALVGASTGDTAETEEEVVVVADNTGETIATGDTVTMTTGDTTMATLSTSDQMQLLFAH